MPASTTLKHSLNVLLDQTSLDRLIACQDGGRISKAHVVREALVAYHEMKIRAIPTCADGSSCRCPHMHTPRPPAAPAGGGNR